MLSCPTAGPERHVSKQRAVNTAVTRPTSMVGWEGVKLTEELTYRKGVESRRVEARTSKHDRPPSPNQRGSKTSIHHPAFMLQLFLESAVNGH